MALDPEFQALLDSVPAAQPGKRPAAPMAAVNAPSAPTVSTQGLDPEFSALLRNVAASDGASNPDVVAAKAAYDAEQRDQQHLDIGPWQTPIPIPHWLNNTLLGIGGRAAQLGQWAKQSLGGGAPDDPMDAVTASQAQTGPAGKVGSFVTDTALTAPIGGAVTSGLARLGGIGVRLAGSALGRAAAQGAVQGAATAPPGERLQGAALGAALSPVLPAVGAVGGKVIRGLARTPEAQALIDRGVQLTPGQMNPTGKVVNRVEQAFTALPLVGGTIANARARGPAQFARSMVEDAVAPGQKLTTASGDFNDLIADAQRGFDQAYDTTLHSSAGGIPVAPRILNPTQPNVYVPLTKAFQQIADQPRLGLTASQRLAMGDQLQEKLAETIAVAKQAGGMTADHLQQLRSDLRAAARDVSPIDNASRAQRAFWNDAQQSVTQALESQLPRDTAQALRAIDSQYGKLAILQNVARAAKDRPGGPTPAMFSGAIAQATAPKSYAAGGGWNRDLSKAAQSVFASTIPHTGLTGIGTVLPLLHGAELGIGGLASLSHPVAGLATLGGLGGIAGAYTRPGLRALAGQTAWQRALQSAIGTVPAPAREAISRYGRAAALAPPLSLPQQSPAPWMATQ